jgi:hypothetical protein
MKAVLLDTGYLIKALVSGSEEAENVHSWILRGVTLMTSTVSWYEFLCGPACGLPGRTGLADRDA